MKGFTTYILQDFLWTTVLENTLSGETFFKGDENFARQSFAQQYDYNLSKCSFTRT